ncbi:MAG: putative Flp pilus-assembly TadE/G-like [Firmicutes bacterium]|nr:putative Flp pilus-assembly TadE/G-like [Bacillota bacterium]
MAEEEGPVLRRLFKLSLREERGSIIVLVALAMAVMIGLAALGTDVGHLYLERQRLVAIADAASLSGAQRLPYAPDTALADARTYLQKNGIDPLKADIQVAADQRHLSINLTKDVTLTFGRIFGTDLSRVDGGATAATTNLSGFLGAAPLGVPKADWQIGQQVNLKLGPGAGSSGNYQALALGRRGAAAYEQNLQYGYDQWIRAGDWVETEPGNMVGPTVRAVQYRINQDPNATYDHVSRQSARLLVIPIVEDFNVNGRAQVHVVGFAVFFLEDASQSGGGKGEVVGRFLRVVTEGEGSQDAPDFGAYITKLVN